MLKTYMVQKLKYIFCSSHKIKCTRFISMAGPTLWIFYLCPFSMNRGDQWFTVSQYLRTWTHCIDCSIANSIDFVIVIRGLHSCEAIVSARVPDALIKVIISDWFTKEGVVLSSGIHFESLATRWRCVGPPLTCWPSASPASRNHLFIIW